MHIGNIRNDNRKLGNYEKNGKSLTYLDRWQAGTLQSLTSLLTMDTAKENMFQKVAQLFQDGNLQKAGDSRGGEQRIGQKGNKETREVRFLIEKYAAGQVPQAHSVSSIEV